MDEVRFMISEAAKQVQVESHVLRYWEEELGLHIGRTEMGHRYYTKDDIQLFLCIQKLKNEGLLLRELKPLIPQLTAVRRQFAGNKKSQGQVPAAADKKSAVQNTADITKSAAQDTDAITKSTAQDTDAITKSTAPAVSTSAAEVIETTALEQVRGLIGDVLTEVVTSNNRTLEHTISENVTANVTKELSLLLHAKEIQDEEHYRKLDNLIRQQQAHRRETAGGTPLGTLRKIFT